MLVFLLVLGFVLEAEAQNYLCTPPLVNFNNTCISSCPRIMFMDPSRTCVPCDSQCSGGCYGPDAISCFQCKAYRFQGRCLSQCPAGTAVEPLDNSCANATLDLPGGLNVTRLSATSVALSWLSMDLNLAARYYIDFISIFPNNTMSGGTSYRTPTSCSLFNATHSTCTYTYTRLVANSTLEFRVARDGGNFTRGLFSPKLSYFLLQQNCYYGWSAWGPCNAECSRSRENYVIIESYYGTPCGAQKNSVQCIYCPHICSANDPDSYYCDYAAKCLSKNGVVHSSNPNMCVCNRVNYTCVNPYGSSSGCSRLTLNIGMGFVEYPTFNSSCSDCFCANASYVPPPPNSGSASSKSSKKSMYFILALVIGGVVLLGVLVLVVYRLRAGRREAFTYNSTYEQELKKRYAENVQEFSNPAFAGKRMVVRMPSRESQDSSLEMMPGQIPDEEDANYAEPSVRINEGARPDLFPHGVAPVLALPDLDTETTF